MADCYNNTVTPRMIKSGQVSVGDRIQLDEAGMAQRPTTQNVTIQNVSGQGATATQSVSNTKTDTSTSVSGRANTVSGQSAASSQPVSQKASASIGDVLYENPEIPDIELVKVSSGENTDSKLVQSGQLSQASPYAEQLHQQNTYPEGYAGITGIPGGLPPNPLNPYASLQNYPYQTGTGAGGSMPVNPTNTSASHLTPLCYEQMTSYMDNVHIGESSGDPVVVTPHVPMTPAGYDEEFDYNFIQAFNGFLRTQIGRYMRIEQLMGSNTIESRFGFLVGVGTNFIILQEMTTGNIMVIDIFSIKLTYVYYSPPVLP